MVKRCAESQALTKLQDIDAQIGLPTILFHAFFYAPLALLSKWVEGIVIFYTIINPPEGFYIVAK
jgi:hypothetical protein